MISNDLRVELHSNPPIGILVQVVTAFMPQIFLSFVLFSLFLLVLLRV